MNFFTSIKNELPDFNFKFDTKTEKEFRNDYLDKSLVVMRIGYLICILLYGVFGFLDIWIVPETKNIAWFIRFVIVIPTVILIIILSFYQFFKRYNQLLLIVSSAIVGLGIVMMIAYAKPTELGYKYYYSGLMLVLIWIYTFIRLRFWNSFFSGMIITLGYEVVAIFVQHLDDEGIENILVFINNNFFIVSANILGLFASYHIEKLHRKDFLQTQTIKDENIKILDFTSRLYQQNEKISIQNEEIKSQNEEFRLLNDEMIKKNEILFESEARFKNMFAKHQSIMWFVEPITGKIIDANLAASRFYGYTIEQLRTMSVSDINGLLPDEIAYLHKKILNYEKEILIFQHKLANGEHRTVEAYSSPIEYEGKKILFTIIHDISERKKVEKQLQYWEEIFKHAKWGITIGSADGKTLELSNHEFDKMHGYAKNELTGRPIYEVFAPECRDDIAPQIELAHQKGHHLWESVHIRKDGSRFPVSIHVTAVKDMDGKVLYRIVNLTDITEKKQAEELLKASQEKMAAILHTIPDMLFIQDSQGVFIDFFVPKNASSCNPPLVYAGQKIQNVLPPELSDNLLLLFDKALKTKEIQLLEYSFMMPDKLHFYEARISNFSENNVLTIVRDITEKHETERLLEESNEKLSLFIHNSPVYSFIKEVSPTESKVLVASENYKDMIGISGSEMKNKTMYDLFPPEFAAKFTADDWEVVANGKILTLDEDFNGRNYTSIKFPLHVSGKNLLGGYTIDITERKKGEQALIESEEKYKSIVNTSMVGIGVAKGDKSISANPALQKLFGYSEEELLNLPFKDLFPPEDFLLILDRMQRRQKGESIDSFVPTRIVRRDKGIRNVNLTTSAFYVNNELYVQSIFIDVTDFYLAQEALRKSEEKFRLMIKNSNDLFLLVNEKEEVVFASDVIFNITGYTADEITGQVAHFIHPDDLANSIEGWRKVFTDKNAIARVQYRHKHKQNGYVWFESVIQNHLDNPAINAIVVNARDITSNKEDELIQKKNEELIIAKEKAELSEQITKEFSYELIKAKEKAEESDNLKSAFLENISHEVRTPMNAILGFSRLLLKPGLHENKRKEFADILHTSTNQLLTIVDNTITLAHIETSQLQINRMDFAVNDLLSNLFLEYQIKKDKIQKSHIELILIKPEFTDLHIYNDYTHINQIFNILLDNAFKFTDNGRIEFGYTFAENNIHFFVKDNGIGIPEDKQHIIFKSFTQADKNIRELFGGLGIGLAIASGLVKLLEGKFTINSKENAGTEIIFSLPLSKEVKQL